MVRVIDTVTGKRYLSATMRSPSIGQHVEVPEGMRIIYRYNYRYLPVDGIWCTVELGQYKHVDPPFECLTGDMEEVAQHG